MTDERSVRYGVLNVVAHPHPVGTYRKIFDEIAGEQVRFWGPLFAKLTKPRASEEGFFQGRILVWTEIDPRLPALDKTLDKEINLDDINFRVPDNVGFDLRSFLYTFREKDHKLFFEALNDQGEKLSPRRAKRILELLFASHAVDDDLLIDVTVVPEGDALKRIWSIPVITKLEIHLKRPNADDIDFESIMQELEKENVRVESRVKTAADRSDGIQPNDETKKLAEIAALNGYVKGEGKSDGTKVARSTKEHPRIIEEIMADGTGQVAKISEVARRTSIR